MALTVAQMVARLTADTSGFYRSMAVANASMIRSGSIISRVAAGSSLALLGMGFVSGRVAGNFQQSMNILQAVSGATQSEFKALGDEAIALGADIKLPNVSAKDAAEAMSSLAKSGMDVKNILQATRGVLQLGIAADIGFADSANAVARSLIAFHLQGRQAVRVADLFTAAANKSTAEITDMTLGFQMASARFYSTGQSIEDLTTALTLMANAGIVGSDAGTSLKTMMNRLAAPTAKAKKEMHDIGFEVYNAAGHFKKLPDLIANLNHSLRGMSEEQRNATMYTIFGSDAIRAATILTAAGVPAYNKMKTAITQGGEAQKFAEARTKGFNGAMQALGSQVETFAIQLGSRMLPDLETATRGMSNFVASLDVNRIANFAGSILGFGRDVGKLAFGTRAGQSALLGLVGAFLTYKTVIGAARAATWAYMLVLNLLTTTMSRLTMVGLAISAVVGLGIAFHHLFGGAQETSAALDRATAALQRWTTEVDAAKARTSELANAKLQVRGSALAVERAEQDATTALQQYGRGSLQAREASYQLAAAKQRLRDDTENLRVKTNQEQQASKKAKDTHDEVSNAVEKLRQHYEQNAQKLIHLGTTTRSATVLQQQLKQNAKDLQRELGTLALKADAVAKANQRTHPEISKAAAKIRDQAIATMEVSKRLGEVPKAVSKMAPLAKQAAVAVGQGIVGGVLAGSSNLGGRLAAQLTAQIAAAIDTARASIKSKSPSKVTEEKIGKPLAEGIIRGYLLGTAELPSKVSDRIRKALDKAKATIDNYRSKLESSWSRLVDDATRAFDAITQQTLTPTESLLKGEEDSRAQAELQRNLDQARRRYSEVMADMDATDQDRADAYQAVQDAEWEIRRAALEKQAAEERKQYEAGREMQKRDFEDRMANLLAYLEKHPGEYKKVQDKIIQLMKSYGVTYDSVGEALGLAYAAGMWKAFPKIRATAQAIYDEVARILSGKAPKKKKPKPKDAWSQVGGDEGDGWSPAGMSPGAAANAYSGGGSSTVVLNIDVGTMVGGDKDQLALDLIDPLRNEIYRIMGRNVNVGIN